MINLSLNTKLKDELLSIFNSEKFKKNIKKVKQTLNGFTYKLSKGCGCSHLETCHASCCETVTNFVTEFIEGITTVFANNSIPLSTDLPELSIVCLKIKSNFFDTCKLNPFGLREKIRSFSKLIGFNVSHFDVFKHFDDGRDEIPKFLKEGGRARSRRKRRSRKNSRKSHRHPRHCRSSHNKKRHTKRYRKRK
jgi:hypothetical protein